MGFYRDTFGDMLGPLAGEMDHPAARPALGSKAGVVHGHVVGLAFLCGEPMREAEPSSDPVDCPGCLARVVPHLHGEDEG